MECNSLSALLSMTHRENTASLKQRNGEWSFRVYWCMSAGVRAKSEVALINESETKRGNAYRLRCILSSALSLGVRLVKHSHRHSPVETQWQWPHGVDQWIEDPSTEHTHRWPQRYCRMHNTAIKTCERSPSIIFWPESDAVTHQLESINKSTYSLMRLATILPRR